MTTLPRYASGAPRRRFFLCIKVGLAVMFSSFLVLIDEADHYTEGFGPWAVITTIVIMQPTLGATLSKGIQRLIGTVFAAVAGSIGGYGVRTCLPEHLAFYAIAVLLCSVTALLNFISTAPERKDWQYMFVIAALTFDFLALRSYHEAPLTSLHRVAMIVAGGLIAFAVYLLPTGGTTAREQAKGMLADGLTDIAEALLAAGNAYAEDRRLRRLLSIDKDSAPC